MGFNDPNLTSIIFQMGRFNHQHPILISGFHSLIPYHPFIALVHPDLAKLGCPNWHGRWPWKLAERQWNTWKPSVGNGRSKLRIRHGWCQGDDSMTIFPTKWRSKGSQQGWGLTTNQVKKRFLEVANVVTHHSMDFNGVSSKYSRKDKQPAHHFKMPSTKMKNLLFHHCLRFLKAMCSFFSFLDIGTHLILRDAVFVVVVVVVTSLEVQVLFQHLIARRCIDCWLPIREQVERKWRTTIAT